MLKVYRYEHLLLPLLVTIQTMIQSIPSANDLHEQVRRLTWSTYL